MAVPERIINNTKGLSEEYGKTSLFYNILNEYIANTDFKYVTHCLLFFRAFHGFLPIVS